MSSRRDLRGFASNAAASWSTAALTLTPDPHSAAQVGNGPPETNDPDVLLGRVGLGDEAAFARLYAQTAPRMLGAAMRLMRQRDRAEDVVQDTYVTIWRKAAQYRPERGAALAWMSTILRHRALDLLRQTTKRPTDDLDTAGEIACPPPPAA
jgi:RNA polymerase sigma-70 factor (ECF subfamily)